MFTVAALWRYPVKSMRGEPVMEAAVSQHGLPGDRAFGIVDIDTGNVLTARRAPRLLLASATWDDGEVTITLPEGTVLDDDTALSHWLERSVTLVRAGAEGGTYENLRDPEHEDDWVQWQGPGHQWHDSSRARVSLVSTRTLRGWHPARFRSNVVLAGAEHEDEDDLVGRRIQLGAAVLDVREHVGRCVMVTRAQPGLPVDRHVLRTIHRERDGNLAIGALVEQPGRVAVGDRLEPRD